MRALAAMALGVVTTGPAWSQDFMAVEIGRVGSADIADQSGPVFSPSNGNLVGSAQRRHAGFSHLGSDVDAKFCLSFGFEFRAPNLPGPAAMAVEMQLDHPPWTSPDGRSSVQEHFSDTLSSAWGYHGYALEESWTMTPGVWQFTIKSGDTVLATQRFDLTVAPGQVFPGGGCAAPIS